MTSLSFTAVGPFFAIPLEAIIRICLAARLVVGRLSIPASDGHVAVRERQSLDRVDQDPLHAITEDAAAQDEDEDLDSVGRNRRDGDRDQAYGPEFIFGFGDQYAMALGSEPRRGFPGGGPGPAEVELVGAVDQLHDSRINRRLLHP